MTEQLPPPDTSEADKRTARRAKLTRDGTLFVAGLLGVIHETVIQETERPALLVLFAGMLGLPVFLNKDEKGKGK